jgi:N-acetylmuramoyl-L-alanine amidase
LAPTRQAAPELVRTPGKSAKVVNNKPLIVIDPGHGGVDPGAQGVNGSIEKDVVLEVGLALRDFLIADGNYDVVMTRDSDAFIGLRDRVDIARRSRADLFISLHADSIDRSGIRGASVYTLSEKASDAEAARLAESENAADVIAGANLSGESAEVRDILIDLAQRETKNFSVNFAKTLTSQLSRETGVTERPHRYAGFKVLKAPDVPSVLLELGFLSDERDEEAMTSAVWQARVAGAIHRSVQEYFGHRQQTPISKPVPTPKRAVRDNLTLGAAEPSAAH